MDVREQIRTFHLTGQGLEQWLPTAVGAAVRPAPEDLLGMYADALRTSRGRVRAAFLKTLRQTAARLQDLLIIDDAQHGAASSAGIAAALGRESAFFRTGALEQAFGREAHALQPMEEHRRARCEATLAVLERVALEESEQPPFVLFHSGVAPAGLAEAGGESRLAKDPCAAALEFCRVSLWRWQELLRTLRVAALELQGAFDSARHTEALTRFDWQTSEPEELAAHVPVAVWEPAETLAAVSLSSHARLLRSGYPVQILAPWPGLPHDQGTSAAARGLVSELGLFSMMHREALVLQSSLARPDHLGAGLALMTASLRPAVAVVAGPSTALAGPWFSFDPDRGRAFREHLELTPATTEDINVAELLVEMRGQVRVIPESLWDDEQIEWTEYLDRYIQVPPLAIPFLRLPDPEGCGQRAIVTRELIHLLRDRRRTAEMLAEMAGVASPPEAAGLEQAKRDGAAEAIHQVLELLGAAVVRT